MDYRGEVKRKSGVQIFKRQDVIRLLERLKTNNKDYTVILKIKDQVSSDINQMVMDEVIACLWKNTVCQAIYCQNLGTAIQDEQMENLIKLLIKRPIWCLNIGETYNVSGAMWKQFCDKLPETSVTHLYVSEHTIDLTLKNKMRDHIRENRKKHNKHCSMRNLPVIERCTNMWWNPINSIRHQLEAKWRAKEEAKEEKRRVREAAIQEEENSKRRKVLRQELADAMTKDEAHTSYWARGYGEGGNTAWRFECSCQEVCSSYENWRFHPTGRQFQCTHCQKWAHVKCIFGEKTTDEELASRSEVLCHKCTSTKRRLKLADMNSLLDDEDKRIFGTGMGAITWGLNGSAGGAFDNLYDSDEDDDNTSDINIHLTEEEKQEELENHNHCEEILNKSEHPVTLWSNLWNFLRKDLGWKCVWKMHSGSEDIHVPSWSLHLLRKKGGAAVLDILDGNLVEGYDYFSNKESVLTYIRKHGPVQKRKPGQQQAEKAESEGGMELASEISISPRTIEISD
eukprot:GSChrysophyteH1.ASY1.ANO1.1183.1 assembled CDS